MAKLLQITLKRSLIGRNDKQREIVKVLGLRKLNETVTKNDSPAIRGMIDKVQHLVEVKEIEA